MRFMPDLRLRTSVTLLLVGTILVTLVIVASGTLAVMVDRISTQNHTRVTSAATDITERVESFLKDIEARVTLAGELYRLLPAETLPKMLDSARKPNLDALYIIGHDGKLIAASIAGISKARARELQGIDLSAYPVFDAADTRSMQWSDKHISAVSGVVTVGLTAHLDGGNGAIIAELPLGSLIKISSISLGTDDLEYWVIDTKGEVVADTNPGQASNVNLYNLPIVSAGLSGQPLPETMLYGGTTFHVSAARSEALGWLFVSRIPAGLENPRLREVTTIILVTLISSVIVGLILAPVWAQGIIHPIRSTAERAHLIAIGKTPESWPHSGIVELNQLSSDLGTMADAIKSREEELRRLNEDLENRVIKRTGELTRSNTKLAAALATVEQAKDELIQSEKLAALGRLVAGMAHELNTPLGNGRMAISTLAMKLSHFNNSLAGGLRRSELTSFLNAVTTSTEIAETNLRRASDLIGSFKDVAADRASSRRRKFHLKEVVDEVLLTLTPVLQRQPLVVQVDVPDDLWLDSYPGELGQVLTNLIENATKHAFTDRRTGTITLEAEHGENDTAVIRVRDDGAGMTKNIARRAFDPFFTTTMGHGGTGLGLFITLNAVTNVLSGTITLHSERGEGSQFEITIPRAAPLETKAASAAALSESPSDC